MKNKLILFDWGNIVESHHTGFSCHDAWNELFKTCGYKGDEYIFHQLSKYKLSTIKTEEEFGKVYEEIKKDFNLNKDFDEFKLLYLKIFDKIDYYKDVADYEISLKDRCYIGILSNLTVFEKERLDKQVGLDNYDYVYLSFEMGLEKPDIKIFERIQNEVPFKPEEILFIDDKLGNITSASKMGWNTLQVTGLELDKIKDKCEEFLK